ncbi:hypothetical protein Tco_1109930 [Tanacetum coccineum]|uniref:Uncharacterized protein n=1 Tax=Tanacetum coccineum TaxID=301880 RepID=A0ABQ5IHE3_9ASTR
MGLLSSCAVKGVGWTAFVFSGHGCCRQCPESFYNVAHQLVFGVALYNKVIDIDFQVAAHLPLGNALSNLVAGRVDNAFFRPMGIFVYQ